ncbi:MAG: S8 family serine peptidase [Thermoanaerobaculales bacterium]|nr:S8 family serine peptidase [Thermoanaerobaculales bacterium]
MPVFHPRPSVTRAALALAALATVGLVPARSPAAAPGRSAGAAPDLVVLEVRPRRGAELRAALEAVEASVVAYLAPGRWLVAGDRGRLGSHPAVSGATAWRPSDGISPELRSLAASAKAAYRDELQVIVVLAPGADPVTVAGPLAATGAEVGWLDGAAQPGPQVGLRVPGERLAALLVELERTPSLVVAEAQAPIRLRNAASAGRCQSGEPGSTPIFDRGLHGEGQVIGIMDTGLDVDDCRFDDPAGPPALNPAIGTEVSAEHRKVLAVDFHWSADWPPLPESWDSHGHGTHVAGSAAGDELANGRHDGVDGMAPAARLVIQDGGALTDDCADLPGLGCPVKPLEPVLAQAWAQGARIHSNSWGDEENLLPFGRYTERTADVDRFVWNHRDTLVVFAAGNGGPADDTIGSPATGKNVLAVGATVHGSADPACVALYSSRGRTRDGRIKPDVVAPGTFVVSAATNFVVPSPSCSDAESSGTSMAAPTVAGLAALVRQYFSDGFHPSGTARAEDGFEPSAALVKGVLIASAVDLSTEGCADRPIPSPDQGWGMVRLDTALAFAGGERRLVVDDHREGFVSAADPPVRLGVVVTEPGPLKVVLAWTDAPSSSLASANLLNDLDLVVSGPGGLYRGNRFAAGVSVTGGTADRLNNLEVVWLPDAGRGAWTIDVVPHAVPAPGQDFALVVTGPVRLEEGPRQPTGRRTP